jgi:hypothetical protein
MTVRVKEGTGAETAQRSKVPAQRKIMVRRHCGQNRRPAGNLRGGEASGKGSGDGDDGGEGVQGRARRMTATGRRVSGEPEFREEQCGD